MEKVLEQISEIIRVELLKRGFIVDVTCKPTKDYEFKVTTTEFQTTPVLFDRIWIESWYAMYKEKECNNGKYIDYSVTLSAIYERFNGGQNAVFLFGLVLRKFENLDEVSVISIN